MKSIAKQSVSGPWVLPKGLDFWILFGVLFGDHVGLRFQLHPDLLETLRTQKLYAIISPGPAPRRRRVKFSISPDGLEKLYAISNKSGASPAPEARKVFNKSGWPQETLRDNNKSGASPAPVMHKVFQEKLYAIISGVGAGSNFHKVHFRTPCTSPPPRHSGLASCPVRTGDDDAR